MKQRMWTRSGFIAVAILLVADRAAAQGAPRELYNKTIQISFNITVPARTSDGRNLSAQRDTTYRIYVSTAGRVFARELRHSGRNRDALDKGPESRGASGSFSFAGTVLVGTVAHISGARRVTVNFNPGFQGCSVSVIIGKEVPGKVVWKGIDGVTYTATGNLRISTPSCSIREGNLLNG